MTKRTRTHLKQAQRSKVLKGNAAEWLPSGPGSISSAAPLSAPVPVSQGRARGRDCRGVAEDSGGKGGSGGRGGAVFGGGGGPGLHGAGDASRGRRRRRRRVLGGAESRRTRSRAAGSRGASASPPACANRRTTVTARSRQGKGGRGPRVPGESQRLHLPSVQLCCPRTLGLRRRLGDPPSKAGQPRGFLPSPVGTL